MTTDEQHVPNSHLRLGLLNATYSALLRHHEVLAAISASSDRSEANAAIQSLLGVDRTQADAVLELRWNCVTVSGIRQIADAIAEISSGTDIDDRM